VPLEGAKVVPCVPPDAVQFSVPPEESGLKESVSKQVQPLLVLSNVQSEFASKLDWLPTIVPPVQLHATGTELIGPVKVKVPPLQAVPVAKMVTFADPFGANVPPDGVNVTPERSLVADQLRLPEAPGAGARVTVQVQPLP
jgi:hypothetical protein